MNLYTRFFLLIIPASMIIGCEEKKISREEVDRIGKAEYAKNKALTVELDLYLIHAQKCQTEYEIESYIDSLPILRETTIKSYYGDEENWKGQLSWLKEKGAKKITFTPSINGDLPRPIIHRTQKSPWGH